jgi:hypothetical protein
MNNKRAKKKAYTINTEFIKQELDNQTTLFDPNTSTLYTLNETASYIFQLLEEKKEPAYILQKLITEYNISLARAEKDLNKTLKDFLTQNIIY